MKNNFEFQSQSLKTYYLALLHHVGLTPFVKNAAELDPALACLII